jgi:hypothetical protein
MLLVRGLVRRLAMRWQANNVPLPWSYAFSLSLLIHVDQCTPVAENFSHPFIY